MTNAKILVNYVDSDETYIAEPSNYIEMDLTNDYFIHSQTLADLLTHEPTADELNVAAAIISDSAAVTIAKILLMDYSHSVLGSYYTHLIHGTGGNHRYSFCLSFDGATATEPQLEAWDDSDLDSYTNHVLGAGTINNSMVKAVCTTLSLPGVGWAGTPLAGANVLLLNGGNGALTTPGSGLNNDLYCNLKIVIPMAYAIPKVETFVLAVRYSWV